MVSLPDMQGPVNIATMLMDTTGFLTGMYEKPGAVSQLLRICTDLILGVVRQYRQEFKDNLVTLSWPHIWFPSDMGISLTQDSMPILSPALYRQFELLLVKEISARCGGVYIHCCGECKYMLDALREIPNLRGMDHGYPCSHAEVILEKLGTQVVLTSGVTSRGEVEFPTYDRYLEHLFTVIPPGARIWYQLPADDMKITARCLKLLGVDDSAKALRVK